MTEGHLMAEPDPHAERTRYGRPGAPWGRGSFQADALVGDLRCDVVIVGAGITGLTAALGLLERGRSVIVLEALQVGGGTTGLSTGKVTSQHGVRYRDMIRRHGLGVARRYARRAQAAVRTVGALVEEHEISCDLREVASFLHTDRRTHVDEVRAEGEAAASLGLPAAIVDEAPVPYPVHVAVRFTEQLEIDPARYVDGLAHAVVARGGVIHEHTRVTALRHRGGGVEARTAQGRVRAGHAIVATLSPTVDPVATFARTSPERAYGIATRTEVEAAADHAYVVGPSTRSTRRIIDEDGTPLLVVVGSSHRTGAAVDPAHHLDALIDHARRHWGADEVRYHWSAQDHISHDGLPLVGGLTRRSRVLVATGAAKWGLTLGTAAAIDLTEAIVDGRPLRPFQAARVPTASAWPNLVTTNLKNVGRLLRGRSRDTTSAQPPKGEGLIISDPRHPLAVATDLDGTTYTLSAACTHLGCTVRFNALERSWDCPCHGSRFAIDGRVLEGPAVRPLQPRDPPAQHHAGDDGQD